MRSKIITSVLAVAIVGSFAYGAAADVTNIKQHVQEQQQKIQQLDAESKKLDKKLSETQAVKEQTSQEVLDLEKQTQDAATQRQQLEAELGAN